MNCSWQASLSITNSQSPPKPVSIKSVIPSYRLILCRPPSPPAFNLSQEEKGTTEENQPDIWLMNCYWIANIFDQDEILVDEVHIIMDFML